MWPKDNGIVFPEICLSEIHLPEISREEAQERATDWVLSEFDISLEIKMTSLRCKNRKRFVKLLMWYGYSRNAAQRLADDVKIINRWNLPIKFQLSYQNYLINTLMRSRTDIFRKREGRVYNA